METGVEGIKHVYEIDHSWKFPDVLLKLYVVPSCSKFNSNDSFTRSVFFRKRPLRTKRLRRGTFWATPALSRIRKFRRPAWLFFEKLILSCFWRVRMLQSILKDASDDNYRVKFQSCGCIIVVKQTTHCERVWVSILLVYVFLSLFYHPTSGSYHIQTDFPLKLTPFGAAWYT